MLGRIVGSFDVVLLLVLDGIGVLLDVLGLVRVWVLWIWGLLIAPLVVALRIRVYQRELCQICVCLGQPGEVDVLLYLKSINVHSSD